MLGSRVQFLTSHLQCLHAARRGFCMGHEEGPKNLQKGTGCRLSVSSVHQCVFVLCTGRQHEVYDGLRGTHDPCVRTPRKQVAVQRPTLVSAVFLPYGKADPSLLCFSACFQKTVQPSHRNHACSSAPGGLRPIGLPSTSGNLSVTPGSSHPQPRGTLLKPDALSKHLVWLICNHSESVSRLPPAFSAFHLEGVCFIS